MKHLSCHCEDLALSVDEEISQGGERFKQLPITNLYSPVTYY